MSGRSGRPGPSGVSAMSGSSGERRGAEEAGATEGQGLRAFELTIEAGSHSSAGVDLRVRSC